MKAFIAVIVCSGMVLCAADIHWTGDEVSGTSIKVRSSIGAFVTKANGVTLAEGKFGKALSFEGTSAHAVIALAPGEQAVFNRDSFTVMLWVNPDSVTGRRPLVVKRTSNNATSMALTIRGKLLVFEACDKSGKWSYICNSDKTQINPGTWTHCAAVIESAKAVRLYINGSLVKTHAVNVPLAFNQEGIWIGMDAWGGDPESATKPGFFKGRMDEMQFFTRALSDSEIAAAMDGSAAVPVDTTAGIFYVSPTGSDANPGTKEKPFATAQKARDAFRTAPKKGDAPAVVELQGGMYFQTETLLFTPEDSGTANAPVIWRSAPNETAVISGGRMLTGFKEAAIAGKRAWVIDIPDVKEGKWYFRQLFVSAGGKPLERRFRPHIGMKRVDGLTYSARRKAAPHRAAQIDFVFAPGDIKDWQNIADVEVAILHVWSSSRLRIESVDMKKNIVTFTGMPTFAVDQGGLQPYFIENVKEELDEPGEWYLDRGKGRMAYLPYDGETLTSVKVIAPYLNTVVACKGDYSNGKFVSHIMFSNVTFSHSETPLPREGYGGSQGHPDLPAAIELTGAKNITFIRSTVSQTGNYGIGIGMGCADNRVVGCRLYDLGGGGVKVGDIRMNSKADAPELPVGNIVNNCAIFDTGIMFFSANAVWAGITRGTEITHNKIWNCAYSGIAVGWSWSDSPTSCASNIIAHNHISNVLTLVADGASIYTLGRQPGTVIRGNILRDNVKSPFAKEYWQLGLYLDEGSAEMLVENNLSFRIGTHGFNMNGGAQNIIRNNISGPVTGNHAPYIRCYKKAFSKDNIFVNNIAWCDGENMIDEAWDRSVFDCRSNVYWNFAGKTMQFKDKTFAEWQAAGQDTASRVIDPQFIDAANDDYRLKPSSPAIALGFKPFAFDAGLEAAYRDIAASVFVSEMPVYRMMLAPVREKPADFSLDFEDVPLGTTPGFSCNGCTPEANFTVSEEDAKN
ncbi:MAG: LamG-like jellyroll fold domain-containing protein, partial [Spirochaetota bacterium]